MIIIHLSWSKGYIDLFLHSTKISAHALAIISTKLWYVIQNNLGLEIKDSKNCKTTSATGRRLICNCKTRAARKSQICTRKQWLGSKMSLFQGWVWQHPVDDYSICICDKTIEIIKDVHLNARFLYIESSTHPCLENWEASTNRQNPYLENCVANRQQEKWESAHKETETLPGKLFHKTSKRKEVTWICKASTNEQKPCLSQKTV